MNSESQITQAISAKDIILAGDDENSVSPIADLIVDYLGTGRIPYRDAVPGLVHTALFDAGDLIFPGDGIFGSVQVDAIEVSLDLVAFNQGPCCRLLDEDAGIHFLRIPPRSTDRQAANDDVRRGNGDDAPLP